ncbi:MAG: hypothetical protein V4529_17325 [Gemmatimonadota bacterium]
MIELWVMCWRGPKHYPNTSSSFSRVVDWPSVPPEGALINVGADEEGEAGSINSYVGTVYWQTDMVIVETHIEGLDNTNEFDSVRESVVRDGFVWKHGEPMPNG